MEREDDRIDLGAASVETKGPLHAPGDEVKGIVAAGLTDD
ncbi:MULTISPECIES: benenodin family lasso peptide [Sphingomonas]|nr:MULTISPECIES: benenodin family lasso peptide [Sphingomonas]